MAWPRLRDCMMSHTSRRDKGSNPVVGSSKYTTAGSPAQPESQLGVRLVAHVCKEQTPTRKYGTAQHNTTHHSTAKHYTKQPNITHHSIIQYKIAQYHTTPYHTTNKTAKYHTVHYSTIQCSTIQYNTTIQYNILQLLQLEMRWVLVLLGRHPPQLYRELH